MKKQVEIINTILADKLSCRIKITTEDEPSNWSNWITIPDVGYIEISGFGPIKTDLIEWIEINPVEKKVLGRLIKPKFIDHFEDVRDQLNTWGIDFSIADTNIRLTL